MTATIAVPKSAARRSLALALLTQMYTGPAFREAAAVLLREQLKAHYPQLDIDPNIAMLGTPRWEVVNDQVVAHPPTYQALTDILEDQALLAIPALYIEGEHFLTQLPISEPPVHLPVSVLDIAGMLNALAPVMLRGYQQIQLDYLNQIDDDSSPRWLALSNVLRDFWNVQDVKGWTTEDCRMARQLFKAPDLAERTVADPYATRAYVIDIDRIDEQGKVHHSLDNVISVLIGKQAGQEVILAYWVLRGYSKYASLEQLGSDLALLAPREKLQWRLVEPEGSFFDYLACLMISIQTVAIATLNYSELRGTDDDHAALAGPPNRQAKGNGPDLQWYRHALPDWLSQAAVTDLNAYSRHLKDLAALHNRTQRASYQDGIASIQQFALERLTAEMLKEHPDATDVMLGNLQIKVQSPVLWGVFAVPGKLDTTLFSLTELALQNLIALPLGIKTLTGHTTQKLPDWLTIDYLEALVTRVDIGASYPALIKQKLLDDPTESSRRQGLYIEHLRIQLPLLALQYKIRQQAGIDERGYRYVVAALQAEATDRQVEGKSIVIRRLGFVPTRRLDATPDVVDNMFVIGPQDMAAGPCLLYRPLLDQPLTQHPSPANLLYAIQQSDSLRDSVLAWLPDGVRGDYERYVFPGSLPSPWLVADFLVDPSKLLILSGPLGLSSAVMEGDVAASLFQANAKALVKLADRQSVSNAEARWATFKRAGWMIFNAALPFLGRTVGAAAWVWQIMDDLQQVADAQQNNDQQSSSAALTDLLLNLGMAIALHSAIRTAPPRQADKAKTSKPGFAPEPVPPPKPSVTQAATLTSDKLPIDHVQPLHISGAINRAPTRLGVVLDRFKVSKPDNLGDAITAEGTHQHLYRSGKQYYAPVGERWFQVQVDENGTVLIVDAAQPERTGPPLLHNRQGQWFVDARLHLRGGGPKILEKKAREVAQKRAQELRKQLSEFEEGKKTAQQQLQQAQQAMETGPSTSAQARRQSYLQTLSEQRSSYEDALQKLKTLSVHAPTPDYPQKALAYLKVQTELTKAALQQTLVEFTPRLRTALNQLEHLDEAPQARNVDNARQLAALNTQMIKHLEYMQTRFDELATLGKDGARLTCTTKSALPAYSSDDLKALQIEIARDLCLPEETLTSAPEAWKGIGRIIDTAQIAIQCLRDTLREQSESRLDERIDTLSSLVEQFQLLDERLQDFPAEFSELAIASQLKELRDQLSEYRRRAIAQLGLLSTERDILRQRPTPPPTPPSPQRKFIKTRYHGQLIGEPRLADVAKQTWLVEIRSPLTRQVIATFHEKPKGVWVERLKTPPPSTSTPDLQASIDAGQVLLNELPAFYERARTVAAKADRTPFGLELLYHRQARRLEQASTAIEDALTHSNESDTPAASEIRTALSQAIKDVYERSGQQVLSALKQHPPTAAGIEWMKNRNLIILKKTLNRRRLKSDKPDYLDEYTIADQQTGEVLWYAHFHYSTQWTPPKAYLSARLKTVAEHRLGAAAETPKGLNYEQQVAFLRSQISLAQAKQLFFEQPGSSRGTERSTQ